MAKTKSDLYEKIYAVVREIPPGRVTSYGQIGECIGLKSSARVVGYALNNLPPESDVPAHRVLNRNGVLTGKFHFKPPEKMNQLLQNEGVEFISEDQVDMTVYGWNPTEELPAAFQDRLR